MTDHQLPPKFGFQPPPWLLKLYGILSGFGLATVLLLVMGLLTWFATLEQIDNGLHATLNKYFHWKAWMVIPEINGKPVPLPLPGGYWTGALLLLNLILGGLVRAKKGVKHVGNLIAHSGIVLMLVAGGVAHHFEERGNMMIWEKGSSDVAESYFEYVVELIEVDAAGKPGTIHVIRGEHLDDLDGGAHRVFRFPGHDFGLEIAGYLENSVPVMQREFPARHQELEVDGYYLMDRPGEKDAERNVAGCYARVVQPDGSRSQPFILWGAAYQPFTIEVAGKTFLVDMRKRLWPMPFMVHLDHFTAEFHPGTMKPSKFISVVTREEGGQKVGCTIQMNEPMRYEGMTFYQASYGPQDGKRHERMYTVLEVVRNPSEKWPEYSLYVVAVGLLVTFLFKLVPFIQAQTRKHS